MIKISDGTAKAMEFTRFRKKENVSDDEILFAALAFEKAIAVQSGLIFHCLVRNYDNEYANVLFSESMQNLKDLVANAGQHVAVKHFFQLIEMSSVKVEYHEIKKEDFVIPTDFSCIEKGTFSLNSIEDASKLPTISQDIESEYLNQFENTKAHFIGQVNTDLFSEITIGKTLAQTKEICFGYFENPFCQKLLDLANRETMNLDFWYVIA